VIVLCVYLRIFVYPCVDVFISCDSVVCLLYDVCVSLCRHITREFINMKKRVFRKNAQADLQWCIADAVRNKRGRSCIHAYFSTYQKNRVIPSELATIHIQLADKQRL